MPQQQRAKQCAHALHIAQEQRVGDGRHLALSLDHAVRRLLLPGLLRGQQVAFPQEEGQPVQAAQFGERSLVRLVAADFPGAYGDVAQRSGPVRLELRILPVHNGMHARGNRPDIQFPLRGDGQGKALGIVVVEHADFIGEMLCLRHARELRLHRRHLAEQVGAAHPQPLHVAAARQARDEEIAAIKADVQMNLHLVHHVFKLRMALTEERFVHRVGYAVALDEFLFLHGGSSTCPKMHENPPANLREDMGFLYYFARICAATCPPSKILMVVGAPPNRPSPASSPMA